ncbi:MAG: DUF480 domain-containing protein [Gammaproteobacteria bacterium]|nr:DUF480 domain-containing protein [Gammaproteobacteria bacterium]NNF61503.1 DUF480 domain-containing protein [Gammaproteobacteria bacterium]
MLPELSAEEARIIGCLMEKSVITPDQYPLTLNALTNACNQKSGRNPVMALEKAVVERAVRLLDARHLVQTDENFKSGVKKYRQRLCNTRFSEIKLDPAQFAVVCVLLLRGPRTPGELRTNSGRLHSFEDNNAVVDTLNSLVERDAGPMVVELARTPGRRDSEYMHLLSGPVKAEVSAGKPRTPVSAAATDSVDLSELAKRVSALEAEVAELKRR